MRADHAKTKDYCMTRFFGHGQSILQVFETPIALSMMKSVKSQFFPTLLVPISWTLAVWSPGGDTRGPSVIFEAVDMLCPGPFHFSHIPDYI